MSSIADLERRKAEVEQAITNVMKGGQVVQTRNGRVQQANLSELRAERNAIEMQLAEARAAASGCGGTFGTPVHYYGRD